MMLVGLRPASAAVGSLKLIKVVNFSRVFVPTAVVYLGLSLRQNERNRFGADGRASCLSGEKGPGPLPSRPTPITADGRRRCALGQGRGDG